MKKPFKNQSLGFTLIELLVVIAIISLLSSIVLTSLNSARSKARDVRRKIDLNQIVLAMELYYDKFGGYPPAQGGYGSVCNPGLNEHNDSWCRDTRNNNGVTPIDNWIPGLQEFLSSAPHNPKPYSPVGPWPYHLHVPSANQYWLFTALENTSDPDTCEERAYTYFNGEDACTWWGTGLYARFQK